MLSRLIAVALFSTALSYGSGITLLSQGDSGYASYQQNNQNPCVMGDNPCGPNEPIPYTSLSGGGNTNSYDAVSPDYTVGQLKTVVGSAYFMLGLDLNNNSNPQGLQLVAMDIDTGSGFQEAQSWIGDILVSASNNGSGHSDLLFKFFDISGYGSNTGVRFRLKMDPVNPGAESLFLIATNGDGVVINVNDIPEPSTAMLLGGALLSLGLYRRRK